METLGIVVALGALSFLGWKLFSDSPSGKWLDAPPVRSPPFKSARYQATNGAIWSVVWDLSSERWVGGTTGTATAKAGLLESKELPDLVKAIDAF